MILILLTKYAHTVEYCQKCKKNSDQSGSRFGVGHHIAEKTFIVETVALVVIETLKQIKFNTMIMFFLYLQFCLINIIDILVYQNVLILTSINLWFHGY